MFVGQITEEEILIAGEQARRFADSGPVGGDRLVSFAELGINQAQPRVNLPRGARLGGGTQ